MSTLAAATRFTSGRLKKSAHPFVAADKARRTNPCKHCISYRARQKTSVYGKTLASLLVGALDNNGHRKCGGHYFVSSQMRGSAKLLWTAIGRRNLITKADQRFRRNWWRIQNPLGQFVKIRFCRSGADIATATDLSSHLTDVVRFLRHAFPERGRPFRTCTHHLECFRNYEYSEVIDFLGQISPNNRVTQTELHPG